MRLLVFMMKYILDTHENIIVIDSHEYQLNLMKKYPNFKFACSQAQQFEWVLENYPSLFEEIKKNVKLILII